ALDLHRPKPCSPVDSLWSDGTAGHTVTLSWSSSASHPGYELAYIPETDSWDNATIVETSDTTLAVTLPDGGCHLFRVRALCDGNRIANSAWSDAITVCPGVGIGEADGSSAITIYPNPFSQRVTIETENGELKTENGVATAWLTDISGRREQVRLTAEGPGRYSLDLTTRPQATYLLTLTTASGKTYTIRLMKMSDIFTR
ncbi:MAG: T9SS type A sorting domain-containing protein, partial [Bacteroidales bacterium]|nr:T9SS type A sorting domain-containing protein [Bacteroidales bacterium]